MRSVRGEWFSDEAALLAELDQAWLAAQQVPPEFVEAGKAVFDLSELDQELARLVYDSRREPVEVRTDTAVLRAMTFASATQTIELEVGDDGALRGQLVPPHRSPIEVQHRSGGTETTTSDDLGYFMIASVPRGAFRLRYTTEAGIDVVTSWITI